MFNLVYNDPNGQERSIELGPHNNRILVGRSMDCSIQTNNNSVSRVHALIFFNDGHAFIQDPPNGRPTNGTMVNNVRLQPGEAREFFAGNEITCGNFLIKILPAVAAPSSQGAYQQPQVETPYNAYPPQESHRNQQTNSRAARPAPTYPSNNPDYVQRQATQHQQQFVPPNGYQSSIAQGYVPPSAQSQPVQSNEAYEQLKLECERYKSECERLKADCDKFRGELDSAKFNLDSVRTQDSARDLELKELRDNIDERDRKIVDYEVQIEHHDSVVESLNCTIKNLKDQLDYQKSQYHQCKDDLDAAKGEVDDLNVELGSLRDQLESKGASSSNDKTIISDLNRQLNTKSRTIDQNEKEIDRLHDALKEERINIEQLEEDLEKANLRLEESEKKRRDMKKVVEQHETLISDLNLKISDSERTVHNLQDSLRAKGGKDPNAALEELEKARTEVSNREHEIAKLKEKLRAAESAAEEAEAAEELRKRVHELEARLKDHGGDYAEIDELKAENQRLKLAAQEDNPDLIQKIKELEAECKELRMYSSGGLSDDNRENAMNICDNIYDTVKAACGDSDALFNELANLQKLYKAYYRIKLDTLTPEDKARVEKALELYDPKIIFEAMAELINKGSVTFDELKGCIRELSNLL